MCRRPDLDQQGHYCAAFGIDCEELVDYYKSVLMRSVSKRRVLRGKTSETSATIGAARSITRTLKTSKTE